MKQMQLPYKFGVYVLMGIFLIGIVAGVILNDDKTISSNDINSTEKADLDSKGVGNWSYEDYETNEKGIRKLISPNEYQLPEIEVEKKYMKCVEYQVFNESWDVVAYEKEFGVFNRTEFESQCVTWEEAEYTSEEMEAELDKKMIATMKKIARAINLRSKNVTEVLVGEGRVSVGR